VQLKLKNMCLPAFLPAVEDVVALLRTGQANRRVGETNMNERSSRSHRYVGKEACCASCAGGACCAFFIVSNALQHSRTVAVAQRLFPSGLCVHLACPTHRLFPSAYGRPRPPCLLQRVHLPAAEQDCGPVRHLPHPQQPAALGGPGRCVALHCRRTWQVRCVALSVDAVGVFPVRPVCRLRA
jgi:hypothetical protein